MRLLWKVLFKLCFLAIALVEHSKELVRGLHVEQLLTIRDMQVFSICSFGFDVYGVPIQAMHYIGDRALKQKVTFRISTLIAQNI